MGHTISSIIDDIQGDQEKQQLATDALNQMQEIGNQQINAFLLQVTNENVDVRFIPVGQIIHQETVVRCAISNKPEDIGKEIGDTFGQFAKGEFKEGITSFITNGINALLGSYEGNKASKQYYCVTTGELGGILRVDIEMFSWRYLSKQLQSITKNVTAVAIVISSVDPAKVTESSLRSLVQLQYGDLPLDQQQKILQTLLDVKRNEGN